MQSAKRSTTYGISAEVRDVEHHADHQSCSRVLLHRGPRGRKASWSKPACHHKAVIAFLEIDRFNLSFDHERHVFGRGFGNFQQFNLEWISLDFIKNKLPSSTVICLFALVGKRFSQNLRGRVLPRRQLLFRPKGSWRTPSVCRWSRLLRAGELALQLPACEPTAVR